MQQTASASASEAFIAILKTAKKLLMLSYYVFGKTQGIPLSWFASTKKLHGRLKGPPHILCRCTSR